MIPSISSATANRPAATTSQRRTIAIRSPSVRDGPGVLPGGTIPRLAHPPGQAICHPARSGTKARGLPLPVSMSPTVIGYRSTLCASFHSPAHHLILTARLTGGATGSRPSIGHSGDDLNDQKGNADREATVPAGFSGQLSPLPQRLVSNSSCMSIWLSVARQAATDVDVTRSTQRVSWG